MSTTITWLGHNAWSIETGTSTILLDPFLNDSPTAPVKADAVKADYILLSHGHGDHLGDTIAIAQRTGAIVLTNFEVGNWLKQNGVAAEKIIGLNPGGGSEQPFGNVKFTIAHHSSSMPDGSYGGVPGGFILKLPDARIYFACDTGIFLDMRLIGSGGLDLAVLPIGDMYTMGPEDSIEAVKLLKPKRVAPCHYNTWPPIAQDAAAWAKQVRLHTAAEPIVLEPGEQIGL
ncbi:MAG TPA: metal-dependent hydrolase [Lacipirellulaceae bacterium]|jgi:L-ascorbate metabolism protein UlaG (beta-lactamase superfamily)|nr:metal-dependent hydrolase [Lacipirellulaceae bacterium]